MTIRERAEEYVRLLETGSEIVDDTDGPVVAEFRHILPALLWKRGLYLERTARGFIVSSRAPWKTDGGTPVAEMRLPVSCLLCRASWFECGHGEGVVLVVGGIRPPVMPLLVNRERARA